LGRIYYVFGRGFYIDINLFRRAHAEMGRDTSAEASMHPRAVAMTSDGTGALFSQYNVAEWWDLDEQRYLLCVRHEQGRILDVGVTDSRQGVTAGDDGVVRVWDLFTGKLEREMAGHRDLVSQVELTPDGHFAVSASYDLTVRIWDVTSGDSVGCWTCEGRPHVAIPRNGKHLAILDEVGNTYLVAR
jgi:WD40 repeat protein